MKGDLAARSEAPLARYSSRETAVVRVGGAAAVVAGALMIAHQVADSVIGARTTDAPRSLLHLAWLSGLFLAVRGVGVLQRPTSDRIGRITIRLALVGLATVAVGAAAETVSLLDAGAATSSTADPPLPVLVLLIAALVALVVGLLAFALGVVRAAVLPRWVGVILLLGVLTKMLAPQPVPSLAIFGLTVAWMGVAMLRRINAEE